MYVDESGDPGVSAGGSKHFILSGLILHQDEWDKYLQRLKSFRKAIKTTYDLNQRTEIHAAELVRPKKLEEYKKITKTNRIKILTDYSNQIPVIFNDAFILNICIDKGNYPIGSSVFELGWKRLLQRYDTFLKKDAKDKGIVISDATDSLKLMHIHRKMRVYNPIPSLYTGFRNLPTDNIIEDILPGLSHHSYFIQTVDVLAYILYNREYPKTSLKKFNMDRLFDNVEPILLKKASSNDPMGIVRQ